MPRDIKIATVLTIALAIGVMAYTTNAFLQFVMGVLVVLVLLAPITGRYKR